MTQAFILLIPLSPFVTSLLIGTLFFAKVIEGESGEKITSTLSLSAIGVSCLLALTFLLNDCLGHGVGLIRFGEWLRVGDFHIDLNLNGGGFNMVLAGLFAVLLVIVNRFSVNYMHREAGFHRFFFILGLFSSAMMMLVLAGNAVFTFIGWELAGACSYLLIGYAFDRETAVNNATRVFITNRIGDAGFLLAMAFGFHEFGSLDWSALSQSHQPGSGVSFTALFFALAAFVKSVQVPFSPWLVRAMEGPTPSSAVFYGGVMIHAGIFLTIQLQGLMEQAPLVMALLVLIGGLTALYGFWVGLCQTDIKISMSYAVCAQLGLMFMECGLGYWRLAAWHLCAHAVVRCYLLLSAPSVLFNTRDNPALPVSPLVSSYLWAFIFSYQRGWLESMTNWMLLKPVKQFATDVRHFDAHIVEPLMGSPAPLIKAFSSLAEREESVVGANLHSEDDAFSKGSGLAGNLAGWTATLLGGFEHTFILSGIGRHSIHLGRELGRIANRFELMLAKPRYVTLFVIICLLMALGR